MQGRKEQGGQNDAGDHTGPGPCPDAHEAMQYQPAKQHPFPKGASEPVGSCPPNDRPHPLALATTPAPVE